MFLGRLNSLGRGACLILLVKSATGMCCGDSLLALSYQEGVVQAKALIDRVLSHKPGRRDYFIGVWGVPNSGKSYLIGQLEQYCKASGFQCVVSAGDAPEPLYYEMLSQISALTPPNEPATVHFLHVTVPREKLPTSAFQQWDPDVLVRKYFGVPLDAHVGIFNPHRTDAYEPDQYGVLISNSASSVKPPEK